MFNVVYLRLRTRYVVIINYLINFLTLFPLFHYSVITLSLITLSFLYHKLVWCLPDIVLKILFRKKESHKQKDVQGVYAFFG